MAVKELIELITIASLLALLADATWCGYEIAKYGLDGFLGGIFTSLVVASVVVAYALYKYHTKQVKAYLHLRFLVWQESRKHINRRKMKNK